MKTLSMHRRDFAGALGLAGLLSLSLTVVPAGAMTLYHVAIRSAPWRSARVKQGLDLIATSPYSNTADVLNYHTTGMMGVPETEGGLISGDLILLLNPAYDTTIQSGFYYNHLGVQLDSLGDSTTFDLQLTETSPSSYPDQASFFLLHPDDTPLFATSDPLGANAIFAVNVTGSPGGELAVYDPAMFAGPDSIILNTSTVGVGANPDGLPRYLRFRSVSPNPVHAGASIEFDVPASVGQASMLLYDIQGRRLAALNSRPLGPGIHRLYWDGRDQEGRQVTAGVYFLRLHSAGGQYVARKLVVAR